MKTGANGKILLFLSIGWVFFQYAMDYEEYIAPLKSSYDSSDEMKPESQTASDDASFSSMYGLRPVTLEQVEMDARLLGLLRCLRS